MGQFPISRGSEPAHEVLMKFIAKMSAWLRPWMMATVAFWLASCGGGAGSGGTGIARVSLTDAPSCYEHVYVTVTRVSIHRSESAQPDDGGWSHIDVVPAQRIDLLELTNGVLHELGQTALPAGRYSQIRLVLAANGATAPYANSVVVNGEEQALDTPSSQQSGLKLNAQLDVAAGQTLDVVLDFDACKSVVQAGSSGKYLLKPVISVIPLAAGTDQAVAGYVDASAAGTTVSLQQAGVVVRSTQAGADGRFLLSPAPQGTYTLVLAGPGKKTAVVTGVPVGSGVTTVSTQAAPIAMQASDTADVTGTIVQSPAPAGGIDATVRALQSVGGGLVEVAAVRVAGAENEPSKAYELKGLATAAPRVAAYTAGAVTPTFADVPGVAGQYRIEASVPGVAPKTADVTLPPSATEDFTF